MDHRLQRRGVKSVFKSMTADNSDHT
jgi:hypothetical protein